MLSETVRFAVLFIGLLAAPAVNAAPGVKQSVDANLSRAVEAYRWFHAHPELSLKEEKTAGHLADRLEKLGLEVHRNVGGHGVVAILENGKGPTVLYRADMDALPITEATGLSYASKNVGVMHACGHDLHMASAVGALETLSKTKDRWSGTVLFVGQPAEEIGQGAKAMLTDRKFRKLLKKRKIILALALHDAAHLPAGTVSTVSGWSHANVDSVDIIVHGVAGHGAKPHQTIDPILIGSEIVVALQSIVSRRVAPGEKAVITVGRFSGGTKHNIIPKQAILQLTVRSYGDEMRQFLLGEIERVAKNVAAAHRVRRPPEVKVKDEFTPAAYNDPTWTERLHAVFVDELSNKNVKRHGAALVGEDFGRYAKTLGVPGVMFSLGAVAPKKYAKRKRQPLPGLHSDIWAPAPKPTLRTAMRVVVRAIYDALPPKR